jgi:5'-nucleotidase
MRVENRDGEGECYQVNYGVQAIYNDEEKRLEMLKVGNKAIDKDKIYSICLQDYHLSNCSDFLDITERELQSEKCSKVVSTSVQDTLEEFLRNHQNIKPKLENRLVYK